MSSAAYADESVKYVEIGGRRGEYGGAAAREPRERGGAMVPPLARARWMAGEDMSDMSIEICAARTPHSVGVCAARHCCLSLAFEAQIACNAMHIVIDGENNAR